MHDSPARVPVALDVRDIFAFVGLGCLAIAAAALGWTLGGSVVAVAAGVGVVGAGLFYIGVFHGRR